MGLGCLHMLMLLHHLDQTLVLLSHTQQHVLVDYT